ncbi:unnamed protein product [Ceutorhynchus assimilis]|uniref:Uncharacterized protein n=1 Tax=Ceutorhynchus assimilis TaxID=467358 RepID=A0A9N9MF05_9CUCU|nr:unnamed protein product [Ceutorhynchus assimilis]
MSHLQLRSVRSASQSVLSVRAKDYPLEGVSKVFSEQRVNERIEGAVAVTQPEENRKGERIDGVRAKCAHQVHGEKGQPAADETAHYDAKRFGRFGFHPEAFYLESKIILYAKTVKCLLSVGVRYEVLLHNIFVKEDLVTTTMLSLGHLRLVKLRGHVPHCSREDTRYCCLKMSSRTKKILELAKLPHSSENNTEENDYSLQEISEIELSGNILLNKALAPEDISNIIREVENVFDNDNASDNPDNSINSAENHNHNEQYHPGIGNNETIHDVNEIGTRQLDEALSSEDIITIINEAEIIFDINENPSDCHNNSAVLSDITNVVSWQKENQTHDKQSHLVSNDIKQKVNEIETQQHGDDINIANIITKSGEENIEKPVVLDLACKAHRPEQTDVYDNDDYSPESETDSEESMEIDEDEIQLQVNVIEDETENENGTVKRNEKRTNKRFINKQLRMAGKRYLGFRKPRNQSNTFHDTTRTERKLGARCSCKQKAKDPTRKCFKVTEGMRQAIFQNFWSNMTWDQRKVYVSNTAKVTEKARPKEAESSRRNITIKYFLICGNEEVPVCKIMYSHTLSLGEWTIRSWTTQSNNRMNKSTQIELSQHNPRNYLFKEDRDFLIEFLTSLNKLPSHYCRKDTDKLYLEQNFQSFAQLHRVYEIKCQENEKKPLSAKTLTKMAEEMNLALFRPRKDQCDICFKYKNGNLSEMDYSEHINMKNSARKEKEEDKKKALEGQCNVIVMDVQSVKLAPQLKASALYYRTKLCCHNYTIYNLKDRRATCYWYDETNADGQASTYASFLVDYLEENFLNPSNPMIPIVIYSDGCTAQNRNCVISNALLHVSEKYKYYEDKIRFKLNFESEFKDLPIRPKIIQLGNVIFPQLFRQRLPISSIKYSHLQAIKQVIPKDCWGFYDSLPHK